MTPPPTFELDVATEAVCAKCGAVYPVDELLRRSAVPLDGRLVLPCFCPCDGAWFDVRVAIEPLGVRD